MRKTPGPHEGRPPAVLLAANTEFATRAFVLPHAAALAGTCTPIVCTDWEGSPPALQGVRFDHIPIRREPSPLADLRCLVSLLGLLRQYRPHAVQSVTPKAGLLLLLAASMLRVPVRVHWFTGQVWQTRTGLARQLLRMADKLIAALATHCIADSPSQRDFLVAQGIAGRDKIQTLGAGSICGVDTDAFRPDPAARAATRNGLGLRADEVLVTFVGRKSRDKGVGDLLAAFRQARRECTALRLLCVGPDEAGFDDRIGREEGAMAVGYQPDVRPWLQASDIFCLPSYREGFGMVLVEAAACALPAVATRITGVVDAVEEGSTALLHEPGDVDALARALAQLGSDAALRHRMAERARERAGRLFDRPAFLDRYRAFMDNAIAQNR